MFKQIISHLQKKEEEDKDQNIYLTHQLAKDHALPVSIF